MEILLLISNPINLLV